MKHATKCRICREFVSEMHLQNHAESPALDARGRHDSYMLVVEKLRVEREANAQLRKFASHVHGALSGWTTTGQIDRDDSLVLALLSEFPLPVAR
jgi:hypothetical protein